MKRLMAKAPFVCALGVIFCLIIPACIPQSHINFLYVWDVAGLNDVYTNREGNLRNITDSEDQNELNPSLSPDGNQIILTKEGLADGVFVSELYLLNLDSGLSRQITSFSSLIADAAWSPTRDEVLFWSPLDGDAEIYTVNIETGKVLQLTSNNSKDLMARWSPDGNRFVFASNRFGSFNLFLAEKDGTNLAQITWSTADCLFPAWSPDGNYIAFSETVEGENLIKLLDLRDDSLQIVASLDEEIRDLTWASSTEILFSSKVNGFFQIYILNVATGKPIQITFGIGNKTYPQKLP